MYDQIVSNQRKTIFLFSLFLILIIAIGWFLGWYYQNPAIFFFAVIWSIFQALVSYYYSDKIALAVSGAREASRKDFLELFRLVENLSIAAGLPQPRIYVIEDEALNAFATGRDPRHAALAVTTGLLAKLDKTEIEGVISHELSHIKNYDIRLMTVAVVLVGVISLIADWTIRWSFWGGGRKRSDENGGQGGLALVGFLLIIFSYLFAWLLQLAISRKREYLADASGALLTRYPEGLARALEKISADSQTFRAANHATAHLFIASPFKKEAVASWFSTHPSIKDRVARLRQMS